MTLRKQAYSNILKILPPKNDKNTVIFHVSAHNILAPKRQLHERNISLFMEKKKRRNISDYQLKFLSSLLLAKFRSVTGDVISKILFRFELVEAVPLFIRI